MAKTQHKRESQETQQNPEDKQGQEALQPEDSEQGREGRKNQVSAPRETRGREGSEAALDLFTDMMIEKIKTLQSDWKKPWFTEGAAKWPKNLNNRDYNGLNALVLSMQAEKNGYDLPVWATFDRVVSMNFTKDKEGKSKRAMDANGNPLPHVGVNKGEKSFPVFITVYTCINNETNEKLPYDQYRKLSEEERQKYRVFPKLQTYHVFNVGAQTNIKEARPELYAKLLAQNEMVRPKQGDMTILPSVDEMIKKDLWICPIQEVHGDEAYYSISKKSITIPERGQFTDGEAFTSNLFHEMAHSTGGEDYLGRLKPVSGGVNDSYSREELVAELSAAVSASKYGLTKHVKEDSAAYLKSWLDNLHEKPDYLKTILFDVKRASHMITQRVDDIQLKMDEGKELRKEDFEGQFLSKHRSGIDEKAAVKSAVSSRLNGQDNSQEQKPEQKQEMEAQQVAKAVVSHTFHR